MAHFVLSCAHKGHANNWSFMPWFAFSKLGRLVIAISLILAYALVTAPLRVIVKGAPQRKLRSWHKGAPSETVVDDEPADVPQGGNVYALAWDASSVEDDSDRASLDLSEMANATESAGGELTKKNPSWQHHRPTSDVHSREGGRPHVAVELSLMLRHANQTTHVAEDNRETVLEADGMDHREDSGEAVAAGSDCDKAREAKGNAKVNSSIDSNSHHINMSDLWNLPNLSWQSRHEDAAATVDSLFPWMARSQEDKDRDRANAEHADGNEYQMGAFSWIYAVLLFGCCGFCQILCLAICCGCIENPRAITRGMPMRIPRWNELLLGVPCGPSGYDLFTDDDQLLDLLSREARLMLLTPLLPLICISQTTCEEGTPILVYALYIPVMIRSKFIEMSILRSRNAPPSYFMKAAIFSTLEHLDWFTDGLYPLQARACDEVLTPLFARSFRYSFMPSMAPVVDLVHFWGLAYVVFLAAALSQQALASSGISNKETQMALAADTAAFVGLAEWMEHEEMKQALRNAVEGQPQTSAFGGAAFGGAPWMEPLERKILTALTKVLLENIFQLRLQVSGFALAFSRTCRWAKYKALLSIGIGLGTATYKSIMVVVAAGRQILFRCRGNRPYYGWIFVSVPGWLALVAVALTIVQLHYAFVCDSHVFNLTSGCVPV